MEKFSAIILLTTFLYCRAFPEEDDHGQDLFQGDMKLTPLQRIIAETGGDVSLAEAKTGRATTADRGLLWLPDRVIPYEIHPDLEKMPEATFAITKAMREWETNTCLRFVKRTVENDYIHIFNNCTGCWSWVGRQGGMQELCLANNCHAHGVVMHELAHAVGVWHEQSRPDRDNYIRVVWDNVPKEKKHNFVKYNNTVVNSLGVEYDYLSLMQYSKTAFGINGSITMDPTQKGVEQLGQRVTFSPSDVKQFTMLYQCNGTTTRKARRRKTFKLKGRYDCTFEKGQCHYMHSEDADFKWQRRVGPTPSYGTGPEADHTTGGFGHYIYAEGSFPRKSGDVAKLISRNLPPTKATCLSFYYHMYAQNTTMMGTLNVYQVLDCPNVEPRLLFSRSGSQENAWKKKSIVLTSKYPYRVTFEAIRGKNYQSDIAIDDISFSRGRCIEKVPSCKRKPRKERCADVQERGGEYCQQWADAGLCDGHKEDMMLLCPKTCLYCLPKKKYVIDAEER